MKNCKKQKIEKLDKKKSTIGKYYSFFKILERSKKIKPILNEISSFDKNFININSMLNQFNILDSGKIIFKIYLNSLINDKIKKTLEFNIFLNNKIKKTLRYPLEENFNGNFFILTDLEVNKGDIIYFNYSLKEKIGKLMFEDNIYYEIEFSSINILEYKSSQIINDSLLNNDQGINYLINKINLGENKILNLKNRISLLEREIDYTELPVGTVIIVRDLPPNYGRWVKLGELGHRDTIIGGETSLGSVIRHKHIWSTGYTAIGNLDKQNSAFSSFNTFDENENQFWMGKKAGSTVNKEAFVVDSGSVENYVYSLAVNEWMTVYKRVS